MQSTSCSTHIPSRFSGKTVLITGGGSGMGKAAALRLGREGAQVVVAGRRTAELEQVVSAITAEGGCALAIATDVSDEAQVSAMIERTVQHFGQLDLAWNNAGTLGAFAPVEAFSLADFDQIIATNLRGVFCCLKYQIDAMRKQGVAGAIVNTSSWTAQGAMPGIAAYAASKSALDGLMRTVAVEAGAHQIRVNNVCPGIIATPMAEGVLSSEASQRPFIRHTPLARIGTPEEVADAVLWLLSEDARFVTGQCLTVDGGYTLGGLRPWLNPIISQHG